MRNYLMNENNYFGAANGYTGFRSNFSKIFSPRSFAKLFIIKGGPGTGKSTLMRKIRGECYGKYDITTILCSSDPNSLDGLILENNGIKIGIVDGTSPHVVEAEYPGAVEEIINLGDGFDYNGLRENNAEIFKLADKKKSNYKNAYKFLRTSGYIYDHIENIFENSSIYKEAELRIATLIKGKQNKEIRINYSDFLLGAFCKDGYKILKKNTTDKQMIIIDGDGVSEHLLLSLIRKNLIKDSISHTTFVSPFSDDIYDMIECSDTCFMISDGINSTINSSDFMPQNMEYRSLLSTYHTLLTLSENALCNASEAHFDMEKIYSSCMLFEKNDSKYDYILETIYSILDK